MRYVLTPEGKERLIKSLPVIAEDYFNGTMDKDGMEFGICFNNGITYKKLGLDSSYAYPDVSALLYSELKFIEYINLERINPHPHNWEQRAIMCLLMAEYLKGL